ncbi:hypothetical protein ACOBQX_03330 [Actinokineospora sp. G85]|uniref:hypothetical protein n=1 Tax=Actinokineospora sp. G85 TaxID=3406626 RepID=UPI003C7326A0
MLDLDALERRYDVATRAAAAHGVRLLCAVKASTDARVLRLAAAHGLGFDVANAVELEHALGAAPSGVISLTPPALALHEKDALFGAFAAGRVDRWHCDSLDQLAELCAAFPGSDVGLRVNLDGVEVPEHIPLWRPSRFGVALDHLPMARETAAAHGCEIRWLHTHNGSEENTHEAFTFAARAITAAAREHGIALAALDLGGGVFADPTPEDLGALFGAVRAAAGPDVEVVLEPGRWWLTDCAALVAPVLEVKPMRAFTALVLDVGLMSHLQWSDLLRLPVLGPPPGGPWRVCGRTCFEEDWLEESEVVPVARTAPTPRAGDHVVLGNVSGYSMELSAEFNGVARQSMTAVRPGGSAR